MPLEPRVTVEIESGEEDSTPHTVQIFLNEEGLRKLIEDLTALSEKNDHFHMFSQDWSGSNGDLSQIPYYPQNTTAHHLKVLFRPDHWDRKYYPHMFLEEDNK